MAIVPMEVVNYKKPVDEPGRVQQVTQKRLKLRDLINLPGVGYVIVTTVPKQKLTAWYDYFGERHQKKMWFVEVREVTPHRGIVDVGPMGSGPGGLTSIKMGTVQNTFTLWWFRDRWMHPDDVSKLWEE